MSFSSSVMSFFLSLTARRSSRWVRPVSLAIRLSTLLRMLLPLVDIARRHPPSAPAPAASNPVDGEAESAAPMTGSPLAARRQELPLRGNTRTRQRSRGKGKSRRYWDRSREGKGKGAGRTCGGAMARLPGGGSGGPTWLSGRGRKVADDDEGSGMRGEMGLGGGGAGR